MTRSELREQAFILIFEKQFNPDYSVDELISIAEETEVFSAGGFAKALAGKTFEMLEKIDSEIEPRLKNWQMNRLSKVVLAILRLSVCEMLYFDNVPVSVSINEAVELAKKYTSSEDASFINALLGAVAKSDDVSDE